MISAALARWSAGRKHAAIVAAIALTALFVVLRPGSEAATSRPLYPPTAITIDAQPIASFDPRDPALDRFGALKFRGGLVLKSKHPDFGGLSAIRTDPTGAQFLSLSDKGVWLKGRIAYQDGHPAGIEDALIAPMVGPDGRSLAGRGWYDTESLTGHDGVVYVGIERVHRIVRFDLGRDGLLARAEPIDVPPQMHTLPSNKGIEGLVLVPDGLPLAGTLIAFSEHGLDEAGNLIAFLIGGPSPGVFSIRRSNNYDISDAAVLPSGDVLILERKFSLLEGIGIRIRRFPLRQMKPGAFVDGPVLFEADASYQVDNMEGLAISESPEGDTVLTLISDDNFSAIQRTLLLQFTLVD